jgi:PAS domain S-box-containing protein
LATARLGAARSAALSTTSEYERLELLTAVGDAADGTLLLGETVQRLLDALVGGFADVATLDVVGLTGEMRRLGARVERPRDERLEDALLRRHQSGAAAIGVVRAVTSGQSQLLAPISDDDLRTIAAGEEDLAMLRALHLASTMYVPLRARGRTVGVLACSTRDGQRLFTEGDLRFAEILGGRIGLALDNAGLSETVSTLERRLEATLANLASGVIVRDSHGGMVFANFAAAELLGAGSVEELFATTAEELMGRFEVTDEQGRALSRPDLPAARAARGEQPAPVVSRSLHRATGRERWILHKATPVLGSNGSVDMVVNVIEDVTEAKQAELAQGLLADVGRELSSSLDYEQTLQRVARLAVPGVADWCGVSLRGDGRLEQVAVAHVDPEKAAFARELAERFPTRLDNPGGAAEVMRTGRAMLIEDLTAEALAATATTEQAELVRLVGMRSVVIVPLVLPERPPLGTLSLVMAESGRRFATRDIALAEELGRRAAAAIENARLYSERSKIAATLQHSLQPPALPQLPGFSVARLYQPAGAGSEVGGDFYDLFEIPNGWMFVVGDVAGHGARAAALTALSRHALRTAGWLLGDPVGAVEELNRQLLRHGELALVSACCARLRVDGEVVEVDLLLAGHPPPLLVRGGRPVPVGAPCQLLGLDARASWRTVTLSLEPDDLLVLYTDGVTDAQGRDERFGEERLVATLAGAREANEAVARIEHALHRFGEGPARDDTAVLAVQRRRGNW